MSTAVKTQADAEQLAQNIAAVCRQDQLDGVDFNMEDGNTPAELQLYVYKRCRQLLGTHALISYTIPAQAELSPPWSRVIQNGAQYFSSITIKCYDGDQIGYDPKQDLATLQSMGVPGYKIFWGVWPGQADNPNEYITVEQARTIAAYVKQNEWGGVMMWALNRDTDHRTGHPGDNNYETGQPDGTYLKAISEVLKINNCSKVRGVP
jgi:hypothetical protein